MYASVPACIYEHEGHSCAHGGQKAALGPTELEWGGWYRAEAAELPSHLASLSPPCDSLFGHVCVLSSCLLGNTALGFEYDFFLEGLCPT